MRFYLMKSIQCPIPLQQKMCKSRKRVYNLLILTDLPT